MSMSSTGPALPGISWPSSRESTCTELELTDFSPISSAATTSALVTPSAIAISTSVVPSASAVLLINFRPALPSA
jgi:hypothetical protein